MVQSTHHLTIGDERVVKRYVSWARDEPAREWRCLELLQTAAPGLAPIPLARRTIDGGPELVMTRLPGASLGDEPLTSGQLEAVALAMTTLHSVRPAALARLDVRISGLASMIETVRDWADAVDPVDQAVPVVAALQAARRWLRISGFALSGRTSRPVLANADGNLANYLWDGLRCRIVDFEDGGMSEVAYEVADLAEHVSATSTGALDSERFVALLDLTGSERGRVRECRRLFAAFWLLMLLPGNRAHARNPPGSLERQATRLLWLLDEGAAS